MANREFSAEELANVLASTSICFDLSVFELFVPLTSGGTVTLTEHTALDLIDGGSHLDAVSLLNTVPSIARELLDHNALPRTAKTINLAGEALAPDLVQRLYQQPHVRAVNNLYGPSEDTTYWTWTTTSPTDERTPIGRPVHNTDALILDADLRPVPVGSIGEPYLTGNGTTRGYHQRPALTASRYLPHPEKPGQRIYRTGDLARWRTDGQLDYHGRTDHQIKLHGHRIELGEVRNTLLGHDDVAKAAVTLRGHDLVAHVSPVLDDEKIRAHLAVSLPRQLVPRFFVFLDQLPHTPNGKIDHNALPAPGEPEQHSPAHRGETDPRRHLARGAGGAGGRRARQLLHARRAFAAGRPRGEPHPCRDRRAAAVAPALRTADRRRAGTGGGKTRS